MSSQFLQAVLYACLFYVWFMVNLYFLLRNNYNGQWNYYSLQRFFRSGLQVKDLFALLFLLPVYLIGTIINSGVGSLLHFLLEIRIIKKK